MMARISSEALEQRFTILEASGLPTPELEELLVEVQRRLAAGELCVVKREGAAGDWQKRWQVVAWVKRALMLVARISPHVAQPAPWSGTELQLAPWRRDHGGAGLAPFGAHLRTSAFIAGNAVITPSAVVQAGAHVGSNSILDAHVLVGNCAYVGNEVLLQAGAIVAGHLLPELALPNVVEDRCQLGGGSGLYDGVLLGSGSILLPGTVISAKAGVFHVGEQRWIHPDVLGNLWIPENVVLGMGGLPVASSLRGLYRTVPMIVGRREETASNIIWYDQGFETQETSQG